MKNSSASIALASYASSILRLLLRADPHLPFCQQRPTRSEKEPHVDVSQVSLLQGELAYTISFPSSNSLVLDCESQKESHCVWSFWWQGSPNQNYIGQNKHLNLLQNWVDAQLAEPVSTFRHLHGIFQSRKADGTFQSVRNLRQKLVVVASELRHTSACRHLDWNSIEQYTTIPRI